MKEGYNPAKLFPKINDNKTLIFDFIFYFLHRLWAHFSYLLSNLYIVTQYNPFLPAGGHKKKKSINYLFKELTLLLAKRI